MTWEAKTPAERKWYSFDFSAALEAGEFIASATWTVASGIELVSNVNTSTQVQALFSGGTLGLDYAVSVIVITSDSPFQRLEEAETIRVRAA